MWYALLLLHRVGGILIGLPATIRALEAPSSARVRQEVEHLLSMASSVATDGWEQGHPACGLRVLAVRPSENESQLSRKANTTSKVPAASQKADEIMQEKWPLT